MYFKDYSGLDISTAWGIPADGLYREAEMEKCIYLRENIKKHSSLYSVKDVTYFHFGDGKITLYHTENTLKSIFEDADNPDTFHRIIFNENENCCAALLNINGKNIYFGGDISDRPAPHPLADHVNLKIAKAINEKIDIYKVPHHGTNGSNSAKTLSIFKPDTAIFTNSDRYLRSSSTIYDDLRRANPDVSILNTENSTVVAEIDIDILPRLQSWDS